MPHNNGCIWVLCMQPLCCFLGAGIDPFLHCKMHACKHATTNYMSTLYAFCLKYPDMSCRYGVCVFVVLWTVLSYQIICTGTIFCMSWANLGWCLAQLPSSHFNCLMWCSLLTYGAETWTITAADLPYTKSKADLVMNLVLLLEWFRNCRHWKIRAW